MTTAAIPTAATARAPMTSLRKTALVAGLFYVLTFVSIPAPLALYGPVHDPNFIVGSGPDGGVLFDGVLEIIVALAGIGTAVTLYPVRKRQNEGMVLGLVSVGVGQNERVANTPGVVGCAQNSRTKRTKAAGASSGRR